jgi:hypothetical protein
MPERPSPHAWRRRLRLSVRGLMVVVLVTGGGLGWVIHRAQVQRDAVAAIKHAGGECACRNVTAIISRVRVSPSEWLM